MPQDGGSVFYESLDGLAKGLEVQGGMKGPERVRDDAGVYLYHDIGDYLSRRQTYQVSTNTAMATPGAGDVTLQVPSAAGLRYGRYLVGLGVTCSSIANLTAWSVTIGNSGLQPGYPAIVGPWALTWGGASGREVPTGSFILLPDANPFAPSMPLWCPPGTYLILNVRTAGVSGTYHLTAGWHTTEVQSATGVPAGETKAPVKV